MKSERSLLLRHATDIGQSLCSAAWWHEGRCNWVGRSPREAADPRLPITPTVAALGPELYGGTAGIALFLAHLHARASLSGIGECARGAIRQALSKAGDIPAQTRTSFYSGGVGVAYSAARVGLLLDDESLVDEAIALAERTAAANGDDHLLDIISGNAGAIAPLLWLSRLRGGSSLEAAALRLATELADAAVKEEHTWRWENDRACGRGVGTKSLCGIAHGASGMGISLIESGVLTRCEHWIEGGLAAFRYEDELYDEAHGNWPDLRELDGGSGDASSSPHARFMIAWCHGAAGIGLARLRALQLLPDRRSEIEPGVRRAIRTVAATLEALPVEADASPCHGRAGLAETLLYATDVLGEQQHAHEAKKHWKALLHTRSDAAPWPCGVPSGRNNPSLMLGSAGIGYGLLRADRPFQPPSLLIIDPALQP